MYYPLFLVYSVGRGRVINPNPTPCYATPMLANLSSAQAIYGRVSMQVFFPSFTACLLINPKLHIKPVYKLILSLIKEGLWRRELAGSTNGPFIIYGGGWAGKNVGGHPKF